jgi:23S rRNA pseudouridine2605 synthase
VSNPNTENITNPAIPTAAQLGDARLKQWHQQGEALLTLENLRSWINAAGLVLFTPRPQITSPSPSLVEAVLGSPTPNPTLEQTSEARSLLARLVAEGLAVPLNLLGVANGAVGETPDFIASTAVFSYVFTLRGDKAWKQPPATSGALKVSNLALATHEALTRRGPLTAYDLTTELGKEVTEAAVLRALAELWTHLRVLPLAQPDGKPAIWELAGTRFVKQIKAGANAGQPSALSALISLYLGQAVVAAEDEIEGFLSPLASRSRIRDVIHALLAARQLDTVAVEGRTMLHVAGALPSFLVPEQEGGEVPAEAASVDADASEADAEEGTGAEDAPRITKYVPKPRKIGTGYLAKAKPAKFAARPSSSGPRGAFNSRARPRASSLQQAWLLWVARVRQAVGRREGAASCRCRKAVRDPRRAEPGRGLRSAGHCSSAARAANLQASRGLRFGASQQAELWRQTEFRQQAFLRQQTVFWQQALLWQQTTISVVGRTSASSRLCSASRGRRCQAAAQDLQQAGNLQPQARRIRR